MEYLFGPNNQFSIDYGLDDFREFALPESEAENYDLDQVEALVKKIIEKHGWKPEFIVLDEAAKLLKFTYYEELKERFDELESELKDEKKLWLCSNLDYCHNFTEDDADSWTESFREKIHKANRRYAIESSIKEIVDATFNLKLLEIALEAWPN